MTYSNNMSFSMGDYLNKSVFYFLITFHHEVHIVSILLCFVCQASIYLEKLTVSS